MKIALVTNIPAPYRIPVYNKVAEVYGDDFLVVFCAKYEPNRAWNLPVIKCNHLFLKEKIHAKKDGYNFVHNNIEVLNKLNEYNPDIVITTGYNPTHLYAWLYTVVKRKKHIPMTDGWTYSEHNLSWLHRWIRKVVFKTSDAYIGASKNSMALFESYGVANSKIFQSHLCVNNKSFANTNSLDMRPFDLMFSGSFHERKLPYLFADVARILKEKIPNLKVLILGDGELKTKFFAMLEASKIEYSYAGYVKQEELPQYYNQSKLFLFTTRLDAWGLVVNEAMASGTPVITTPYAGVINDLVIDGYNGRVLELDAQLWAKEILSVLLNKNVWELYSKNSIKSVQRFTFDRAANGIIEACRSIDV